MLLPLQNTDRMYQYSLLLNSFGGKLDDYPHPELDFLGFKEKINALNNENPFILGPVNTSGKDRPWIKVYKLKLDPVPVVKQKCVIC